MEWLPSDTMELGPLTLDHIGIATDQLASCIDFYCSSLGFTLIKTCHHEDLEIAYCQKGDVVVEFLEPENRRDYTPGIQHVAYRCQHIEGWMAHFKELGMVLHTKEIFITGHHHTLNKIKCIFASGATGEYIELIEDANFSTCGENGTGQKYKIESRTKEE